MRRSGTDEASLGETSQRIREDVLPSYLALKAKLRYEERVVATLFDFNGVLVDDEHVHLEAFREVLRPLGIHITDDDYGARYLGFDDVGAFRAILGDRGHAVTNDRISALVEAKKPAYMAKIAADLRIFEGARELVLRRASRGPVAIVSGALAHEIRFCLEQMGVLASVSFIVSAEDTTACKPDPEGYRLAQARLASEHGSSRRIVVIEDSIAGIVAAKAAGLRCAAVAHSYRADELYRAGADVVVVDLASLDDAKLDGAN